MLSAWLAQEILGVHVLTQSTIVVVFAPIINSQTLVTVVKRHVIHHELEWIGLLGLRETFPNPILVEYHNSCLADLLSLGLFLIKQVLKLLRGLPRGQLKLVFANRTIQMGHRYATGLALSDSPVNALRMENMAASESNAGLLAKFINVAQAAHV